MRFEGETRLFLRHREFFGEIRGGGGHHTLRIECACGWKETVSINANATNAVNEAKTRHYKLPAYVHELELDGDELERFAEIWNAREEFTPFEISTYDDAARLLVWCDRQTELGRRAMWIDTWVAHANAALVLLGEAGGVYEATSAMNQAEATSTRAARSVRSRRR